MCFALHPVDLAYNNSVRSFWIVVRYVRNKYVLAIVLISVSFCKQSRCHRQIENGVWISRPKEAVFSTV